MGPPIVRPTALQDVGGQEVIVLYTWPEPGPYQVQVEILGRAYACNNGQGGHLCMAYGRTLRCYTRAMPQGAATLVLTDQKTTLRLAINVGPPYYPTSTFALRALLPACYAAGPRSLNSQP